MEALRLSSSLNHTPKAHHRHHHITTSTILRFNRSSIPSTSLRAASISSLTISAEPELQTETKHEKFDWFTEWCPVVPVSDLDKRVPHGRTVMGLDIVVWWDKNENTWKVFDDACPHRLAPLSDGRIDQSGRLQCAYHGWCFNGSGRCKLIPQAASDGPKFQTFKKACARVYPSVVQHDIVWFWPNTDAEYKDVISKKKPPLIPELDDPSFSKDFFTRDLPVGYEVITENIMDPAHVPYSHFGIFQVDRPPQVKVDREGGKPLEISVNQLDINGFSGDHIWSRANFIAPFIFYTCTNPTAFQSNGLAFSAASGKYSIGKKQPKHQRMVVFFCVPVSPGHSRLIWCSAKNIRSWVQSLIPPWILHIGLNLIVDSDLHLIHVEEKKLYEAGPENWLKTCCIPTKSDAFVVGFRKWLYKFSDGQVQWNGKFSDTTLPPTPPREQLMDRYWTHVMTCKSCKSAYKSLNVVKVALQVMSVVLVGIAAATNNSGGIIATSAVLMSIFCYAASNWLARYVYKNFHYHDYNHALV